MFIFCAFRHGDCKIKDMSEKNDTSPFDPVWLTEQAVKALEAGCLDEAAQYLHAAKSQLMDNLKSGDQYPLRRMTTDDISIH